MVTSCDGHIAENLRTSPSRIAAIDWLPGFTFDIGLPGLADKTMDGLLFRDLRPAPRTVTASKIGPSGPGGSSVM